MNQSISSIIEMDSKLVFKPKKEFYETTGINKKRWGQIYRGEKEAVASEIKMISEYFNLPIEKFFKD